MPGLFAALALRAALAQAFPFEEASIFVASQAKPCAVFHRERIHVRAQANSVSPFLWVTWAADHISGKEALRESQAGRGDDIFVFLHTRTLDQNADAVVTAACPDGDSRIVGVQILSGEHKGSFGFLDVRDVRF